MSAILGVIMTNLIVKIFLGYYHEILNDNIYVYNLGNHTLYPEKYILENSTCLVCKKITK